MIIDKMFTKGTLLLASSFEDFCFSTYLESGWTSVLKSGLGRGGSSMVCSGNCPFFDTHIHSKPSSSKNNFVLQIYRKRCYVKH